MWKLLGRVSEILKERGVGYLIKYVLALFDYKTGLISLVLAPYIAYKIKKLTIEEALKLLFSDNLLGMLFKPMQIEWEIRKLLEFLKERRPNRILEIGTAHGGTLLLFTKIASENALIISVDLPGGPFGGGYPWLRTFIYKLFAHKGQRVVLIRGNSHSETVFRKIIKVLNGAKLDFLFIDGDHTYEGVKKDFEMYSSLVRSGGIIALHDVVPRPPELVGGVPSFWEEIKQNVSFGKAVLEIIKDKSQVGYGIGIIIKR